MQKQLEHWKALKQWTHLKKRNRGNEIKRYKSNQQTNRQSKRDGHSTHAYKEK